MSQDNFGREQPLFPQPPFWLQKVDFAQLFSITLIKAVFLSGQQESRCCFLRLLVHFKGLHNTKRNLTLIKFSCTCTFRQFLANLAPVMKVYWCHWKLTNRVTSFTIISQTCESLYKIMFMPFELSSCSPLLWHLRSGSLLFLPVSGFASVKTQSPPCNLDKYVPVRPAWLRQAAEVKDHFGKAAQPLCAPGPDSCLD